MVIVLPLRMLWIILQLLGDAAEQQQQQPRVSIQFLSVRTPALQTDSLCTAGPLASLQFLHTNHCPGEGCLLEARAYDCRPSVDVGTATKNIRHANHIPMLNAAPLFCPPVQLCYGSTDWDVSIRCGSIFWCWFTYSSLYTNSTEPDTKTSSRCVD